MKRRIWIIALLGVIACVGLSCAKGGEMIAEGKTVKIDYTLTVDGNVVESSEGKEPLEYVQGNKMIIPGLEKGLEGLKAGDEKSITVAPEDAYGQANSKMVVDFPKDKLNAESEPQVGMALQTTTQQGQTLRGVVTEVGDQTIKVDFNHPLAGKTLTFDVKVVEVK